MAEQVEPSCFVSKLKFFIDLNEREQQLLADFEKVERSVSAGEAVYHDGDPASELFVVKSGWLYSCRYLENGQRQVFQLRHPGDLSGMNELMLSTRSASLITLEDSVVCPLPRRTLRALTEEAPRVALLLKGLATLDHVLLLDVLQAVARTSATDRLLHLLLHLYHRLRMTDPKMGATFRLPITQTLIGDMLGLTNVTVSKSMTEMENDSIIKRSSGKITLLDIPTAIERIGYRDRFSALDLSWIK